MMYILMVEDVWDEYYEEKFSGVFDTEEKALEAHTSSEYFGRSYKIVPVELNQWFDCYYFPGMRPKT